MLMSGSLDVVAIVNPISGAGLDRTAAQRRVAMLRQELERRRLRASIVVTTGPGHARDAAAGARNDRAALVLVWGGDGTVNEAGAALVGGETALGLIPAGSGNGLAAALGLPRSPEEAIAAALDGRRRAIDTGTMAGRSFFNVAGIGFDARIARLFNERAAGSRGRWPYVVLGIREGCRYRGAEYCVALDGHELSTRALLIVFANGREFGMGARIAPEADLADGLLDAIVVEDRPLARRFWDARHLAFGTIAHAPRLACRRIREARVESNAPLDCHVDGEPFGADGRVEVRIVPRSLWVQG
jgi:YegS/Rv2252/BmrU family lipid kinase